MRLIDADALWRDAPNAYADCFENCDRCTKLDNGDLYELIEKQPTVDAVSVVRCKDCRHRDPEDHKCDSGEMERQGCPFKVADDYFCAYGER